MLGLILGNMSILSFQNLLIIYVLQNILTHYYLKHVFHSYPSSGQYFQSVPQSKEESFFFILCVYPQQALLPVRIITVVRIIATLYCCRFVLLPRFVLLQFCIFAASYTFAGSYRTRQSWQTHDASKESLMVRKEAAPVSPEHHRVQLLRSFPFQISQQPTASKRAAITRPCLRTEMCLSFEQTPTTTLPTAQGGHVSADDAVSLVPQFNEAEAFKQRLIRHSALIVYRTIFK